MGENALEFGGEMGIIMPIKNFNFCRLISYYVSSGWECSGICLLKFRWQGSKLHFIFQILQQYHWWQCYSSCSWQWHCFLLNFRHCRVVSGNLHVATTPLWRRILQLLVHRLAPLYGQHDTVTSSPPLVQAIAATILGLTLSEGTTAAPVYWGASLLSRAGVGPSHLAAVPSPSSTSVAASSVGAEGW